MRAASLLYAARGAAVNFGFGRSLRRVFLGMETGSYMLIERGMTVRGTDGDLGTVSEVVADTGVDVFRGIVLAHGWFAGKHGFIPGDRVVSVEQNVVRVSLSKTEAEHLPAPTPAGQTYQGRDVLQ